MIESYETFSSITTTSNGYSSSRNSLTSSPGNFSWSETLSICFSKEVTFSLADFIISSFSSVSCLILSPKDSWIDFNVFIFSCISVLSEREETYSFLSLYLFWRKFKDSLCEIYIPISNIFRLNPNLSYRLSCSICWAFSKSMLSNSSLHSSFLSIRSSPSVSDDKTAVMTISLLASFANIPIVSVFLFCKFGLKCFIRPVSKISIASNRVVLPYPFCPSKMTILRLLNSNTNGFSSVIYLKFLIQIFLNV